MLKRAARCLRRFDAGQGAGELAGIIAVVVILATTFISYAPGIGEQISYEICRAISRLAPDIQCVPPDYDHDRAKELEIDCDQTHETRTDSIDATIYFIRAGEGQGDELIVHGDGSAEVILLSQGEIGVGADGGTNIDGVGLKGEAAAVITGETARHYYFDSEKEARAFLDDRKSWWRRIADHIGPGTQAINEAWNQIFGGKTADAISFSIGVSGRASGTAVAGGGVSGNVEISANGRVKINKDGTSSFTGAADIGGSIALGVGFIPGKNDAFFGFSGGVGAGSEYSVEYDSAGNPTKLTITATYSGYTNTGSKTINVNSGTLDLTNPANRAAFDDAFWSASNTAGGQSFGMAGLNPLGLANGGFANFMDRMQKDGYFASYTYAASDSEIGGSVGIGAFGGGFSLDSTQWSLSEATGRDMRYGGREVALATCK